MLQFESVAPRLTVDQILELHVGELGRAQLQVTRKLNVPASDMEMAPLDMAYCTPGELYGPACFTPDASSAAARMGVALLHPDGPAAPAHGLHLAGPGRGAAVGMHRPGRHAVRVSAGWQRQRSGGASVLRLGTGQDALDAPGLLDRLRL